MYLAVERGEVDGATGGLTNLAAGRPEWLKNHLVNILVQFSAARHSSLSDVPTILELLSSTEDRELMSVFAGRYRLARPLAVPPSVPEDRVAALRAAFSATMIDPDFLTEAKRLQVEIDPTSGAAAQAIVQDIDKIPQATIDRLRAVLQR